MNPLVATTLRQMQAEGIAFRLPEDLDDLLDLERLANVVTADTPSPGWIAATRPELHLSAGIILRRLSIGAALFYDQCVQGWCRDVRESILSVAYCMAEGRNPSALWAFSDAVSWRRRVNEWARAVPVDIVTLDKTIREFLAADRTDATTENHKPPMDLGWLLAHMTEVYGQTPEHWAWTADQDTVLMLWREHLRLEAAKRKQSGETGSDADEDLRALFAYRKKESEMRARKRSGSIDRPVRIAQGHVEVPQGHAAPEPPVPGTEHTGDVKQQGEPCGAPVPGAGHADQPQHPADAQLDQMPEARQEDRQEPRVLEHIPEADRCHSHERSVAQCR